MQLDSDGDGQLSFAEFKVLFDNAERRRQASQKTDVHVMPDTHEGVPKLKDGVSISRAIANLLTHYAYIVSGSEGSKEFKKSRMKNF